MRTKFLSKLMVFGVLASLLIVPVVFAGKHGEAGKSNIAHLYLYEKDPSTWEIVECGAWGKMKYNLECSTFDFVFNGHGLEPYTEYSLIYYIDPGPGPWTVLPDIVILATGTSCGGGNIHLSGSEVTGSIPYEDDVNYPDGGKIWLVLTEDIDLGASTFKWAWNPTEYLFEYDLITYTECEDGDGVIV